jgi:hypothetical protein
MSKNLLNKFVKAGLILTASLAIVCKLPNYPPEKIENPQNPETTGLSEQYKKLIKQHKSGNIPIINNKDSFTLAWDNGSKDIEVRYRQRFIQNWLPLGTSKTNEFAISGLESGIYEFAVYDKDLSVIHTSLDSNAQPSAGWFLMNKYSPEADSNLDGKISDLEMKSFIDGWFAKKYTDNQFSINSDFYVSQK